MKDKKRLLFVLSSLKFGGAEKHTINLINYLDRDLFDISLCYLEKKEELVNELQCLKQTGLFCCEKKNRIDFRMVIRLKHFIEKVRPDTIVCVDPYTGFFAHLFRFFKLFVS